MTESDVANMRRKYEKARERNNELQTEINALCNSVTQSGNSAINTGNFVLGTLGNGADMITKDDYTLHDVEKVRADIEKKFILYKNIETAYKKIRGYQEEMRSQQGCEQKVRRLVIAILDNEEKSLVSDETLMMQASRLYQDSTAQQFFLTFIMMDLIHRRDGETEAADRARKKALEMDERMSGWVYFLIALKRNDKTEQKKSLDILMKQHLMGTERENLKFLTLLALRGEEELSKEIAKYIGIDNIKPLDKTEIVNEILKCYQEAMTVNPPEFKYLKQHVAEYPDLELALRGAMNNECIGGYLQQISKTDAEKVGRGIVNMVLDRVVDDCHSPRSKEILKQIEINQNIITAKGNLEEAAALNVKEEIVAVSDIKLDDCLYDWLLENVDYNGKKDIVDFAYDKLKPSFVRAYHSYVSQYRNHKRDQVSVTLGDYQVTTNLSSASEENVKIDQAVRARCKQQKDAISDVPSILMMVFGIALVILGIVFYAVDFLDWLIFCAVPVGVLLLIAGVNKKYKNYKTRLAVDKKCEEDIVALSEQMQYLVSDMASYRAMYSEADAKVLKDSFFD